MGKYVLDDQTCLKILCEEEASLKKIFPGVSTLAERKKFAIFHACTFILCPVIVMFVMLFTYNGDPHGHPFDAGMGYWIFASLLMWNFFGAWRFMWDIRDDGNPLIGRLIMIPFLIGFPFFYLYNLWCVICKKG